MLRNQERPTGIARFVPAAARLPRYGRIWLRTDLVAGAVTSAVVIPQAMAYASLAGLPVEVGLYTALVALQVYAFLGASRPLSVSLTSTIAILTATSRSTVVQSSDPPLYHVGRNPGTSIFRRLEVHPNDETLDGILILRGEGLLFFGNASTLHEKVRSIVAQEKPESLIVEFSAVPHFEYTGLKQLTELEDELQEFGVILRLPALNPLALEVVEYSTLGATLGHARMFFDLSSAVEHYEQAMEKSRLRS